MKLIFRFIFFMAFIAGSSPALFANEPDSVYLFAYTTTKDNGRSGLHFAHSINNKHWTVVGNEFAFVKSDYGAWGAQKQMNSPYLLQTPNGEWHCIWSLNNEVNQLAHAASPDLVTWGRQSYPYLQKSSSFQHPVVHYDPDSRNYKIVYKSGNNYYQLTTADFKQYSDPVAVTASAYQDDRVTITLPVGTVTGTIHKVAWPVAETLVKLCEQKQYENGLSRESWKDDSLQFAGLKTLNARITLNPGQQRPISDMLTGVFFEDINYAADGGLYAELIQNRDFEYQPEDKQYRDSNWTSTYAWSIIGEDLQFSIDSTKPLHANNPHYATLLAKQAAGSLVNSGYDGIAVVKDAIYNFSIFARNGDRKAKKLLVKLVNKTGATVAETTININSDNWKKYTASLKANTTATDAVLELQPLTAGNIQLDMISLFPEQTFKNRPNGMRADLGQAIADIHPRFIRFPGGCVAHGDGLQNIYRWKNTVGPLEARKPQRNLWGYHQSAGIGYYEYFRYCEDIGAEPLPVVAAGVPCQNSHITAKGGGQQGGIPLDSMDEYVQDILDLVEWANGPANSKWGSLRAAAGHPAPFNLKYIGIGNEDLITDVFEERFRMIYKAVQQKHPEITVIGTVGPFFEGTDYKEGWDLAAKLKVPMVDEHYYVSPGWFINNQDFYDSYDRSKPKVYLGEYASWGNALYNALAEAAYLTNVERNGDIVSMTSYAPLLAKEGHTQWNPDMIYFNNTEVKPTVNYEVQKLFGQNAGSSYIPTVVDLSGKDETARKRMAVSVVQDTGTKDIIIKMVNLLPVAINTTINLDNTSSSNTADKWVLQGHPDDKNNQAVHSMETVDKQMATSLAPYSFTVLRLKENNSTVAEK